MSRVDVTDALDATLDELLAIVESLVDCLAAHHPEHVRSGLDCELCRSWIPTIQAARDRATAGLEELGR